MASRGKCEHVLRMLLDWTDRPSQPTITLAEKGPQWHFLQAIPVLHGVFLANKTLGSSMPKQELATQIIASYEERLSAAAATLEARSELTRYDDQALQAWRRCIRD